MIRRPQHRTGRANALPVISGGIRDKDATQFLKVLHFFTKYRIVNSVYIH